MTDSMREDLEAALESNGVTGDDEIQEEVLHEASSETEPNIAENLDSTGTEIAAQSTNTPAAEATKADGATGKPVSTDESAVEAAPDTRSMKAPVNWGPKEREDWSKIPRNLQEKIMSRENETQTLMQDTAEARRTHSEFGNLVQQYGSVLSGVVGDTPMEAVSNLFSTVANLRMGQPMEKAQIIAGLINDFGVDIHALDSTLSGQMPEQGGNADMERMLNERMAPVNQLMEQMKRQEQSQHQGRQDAANNEVGTFARSGKAEFLNEVRMDMADLLDMSAKRGENMTMPQAYAKACALNPDVSAVLAQRAAQQKLTGGNNNMAAKKHAASSITGSRVGVNTPNGNMSLRETLSSAWDGQAEG